MLNVNVPVRYCDLFDSGKFMKEKKSLNVISAVMILFMCGAVPSCSAKKNVSPRKFSIVATGFPCYDFARAVAGTGDASRNYVFSGMENTGAEITMLIKPGMEVHSFDPSPVDIISIRNADLFVHVGGESDEWVEKIMDSFSGAEIPTFVFMENVRLLEEDEESVLEDEEKPHGHHGHGHGENVHEADEHVWTSPENSVLIVNALAERLSGLNPQKREVYRKNAGIYTALIVEQARKIRDVVNSKEERFIVMGDRFPLRYFADEFGIEYVAAFSGCSTAVEANPATLAALIATVREKKLPAVFTIELSNRKIASVVAESSGAEVIELNAAHNLTKKQFDSEFSYIDALSDNADALARGMR